MATLFNVNGASLTPDMSGMNNLLLQAFGSKQQRDKATEEKAILDSVISDITGEKIGGSGVNAGDQLDRKSVIIDESGAMGKRRDAALIRLAAINPQAANSIRQIMATNDEEAKRIAAETAAKRTKESALIRRQPTIEAKRNMINTLASQRAANNEDVSDLLELANLDEGQLDTRLLANEVMGRDIETITKLPEIKEIKTEDEQGRDVTQTVTVDPVTGKRTEIATQTKDVNDKPLTDIGKARDDLKNGRITQSDFNALRKTPDSFKSTVGKLIQDKQTAVSLYGEGSPQVQALEGAIQEESKGESGIKMSDVAGMRKEHTKLSGEFIEAHSAYKKVQSATDTAAGDVALVFNFMKTLDPGSVVREGEFAVAAESAGLDDRLVQLARKVDTGERLTPEQRKNFKDEAKNIFKTQIETQRKLDDNFKGLAERNNIDPDSVVIDFVGDVEKDLRDASQMTDDELFQ